MSFKKAISAVLLVALLVSSVCVLGACTDDGQQTGEVQTITIPDVKVDLKAPENRVQVSETNKSQVFDANGLKLSDTQWLMNSKFSKSYIQSLGVGEYTFTYQSETEKGTIKLIITDNEEPDYVFVAQVADNATYQESLLLPELVKNQDSYQDDYEISYTLKLGDTVIETEKADGGYKTPALAGGEYTWTASLTKNGTVYDYRQSFKVQSFEEYLTANMNALLMDEQQKTFKTSDNGVYHIDTTGNTEIFRYTITQEIMDKALAAGKTRIVFTVTTDDWYVDGGPAGHSGSFWMTDCWKDFKIGWGGEQEFVLDKSADDIPYITSMKKVDGKYVYIGTAFLESGYFTTATPLQLWFAGALNCKADVTVTFE